MAGIVQESAKLGDLLDLDVVILSLIDTVPVPLYPCV
jgi:hypothetical protein